LKLQKKKVVKRKLPKLLQFNKIVQVKILLVFICIRIVASLNPLDVTIHFNKT
jgi:hypothetical protein